jgi:hypothetical protein
MPHLFVDISAHGLGHLAQTGPVLDALRAARPDLRLTVRSALPRERLARRIAGPFDHIPAASDFGFAMANALDVNLAASAARYREFHAGWEAKVEAEAAALARLAPDAVLANVTYLPLAGAARAGIPAAALCSLNWADLFRHYFESQPWASAIHGQIRAAYQSAAVFLRLTPGMPVAHFGNEAVIGPIAAAGPPRLARPELAAALGIPAAARWVLVGLGGFDLRLPVERWQRPDDLCWLVPAAWQARGPGIHPFDPPGLAYADVMAHADALLTKPGYGSFAEAAVRGIPVAYLRRPDWPEESWLIDWLQAHGRAVEVSRGEAAADGPASLIEGLWGHPAPPPPAPTGIAEAAERLGRLLG